MDMVNRFDVYLVSLDPTLGSEIKKSRPCVVVSPNEMNKPLSTIVIAPMTSTLRGYPTRVRTTFQDRQGEIALDQIRAVDKARLYKKIGTVNPTTTSRICSVLTEMFSK